MEFHQILKNLRVETNKRQGEFAKSIGVEQSKYNKWENGVNTPDIDNIIMLARRFGVTTDYLLGVTPYRNDADKKAWDEAIENQRAIPFAKQIIELVEAVSDAQEQEKLYGLVNNSFAVLINFMEDVKSANQYANVIRESTELFYPLMDVLRALESSDLTDEEKGKVHIPSQMTDAAMECYRAFIYRLFTATFDFSQLEKVKSIDWYGKLNEIVKKED